MIKKETPTPLFPLSTLLTFCLLCTFIYSLYAVGHVDSPLSSLLAQTSEEPRDARFHLELAKQYMKLGNRPQAAHELILAKQLTAGEASNVLGETTHVERELIAGPERLQKEQAFWQDVVNTYPNYRDGWVQLYVIATNLQQKQQANQIVEKIRQLDPNYVVTIPQ